MVKSNNIYVFLALYFCSEILPSQCKKPEPDKKPEWAKKDLSDYTEADMERLLDQWDEDEEPLPSDELPEHLRPQPQIDFSQFANNPDIITKMTKKGKTVMMFVSVDDSLTREETDTITKLWQTSLWNSHLQAERFMVSDNRAIFMFSDGSMAWDAKDFLIQQDKCKDVMIDTMTYDGPAKNKKPVGPEPKPKKTESKDEL